MGFYLPTKVTRAEYITQGLYLLDQISEHSEVTEVNGSKWMLGWVRWVWMEPLNFQHGVLEPINSFSFAAKNVK